MTRRALLLACLFALTATSVLAHDLFLRPDDFFLEPEGQVRVQVLNGNFESSEATVTFDRVTDFALLGPGGRSMPADHGWRSEGTTSTFTLRVGEPGTYLVGVSTAPRVLALAAADFNDYLESDGIPDVLEARRRDGELEKDVREEYSKHVKAVVQAGEARTGGLDRPLGHPAELVPLDNPYELGPGDALRVRALVDGRPVANQLVLAGGRTPKGQRHEVQSVRTDGEGVAEVRLSPGAWYVKFIHMVPADSTDYESKWATLTFGVR
ncbi:MAG: DUF4198 domain-containing protein [Gemmatimonadota bacterium]|jgi:uncharacterized GH25 family protein